jgi:hypothetical protein
MPIVSLLITPRFEIEPPFSNRMPIYELSISPSFTIKGASAAQIPIPPAGTKSVVASIVPLFKMSAFVAEDEA